MESKNSIVIKKTRFSTFKDLFDMMIKKDDYSYYKWFKFSKDFDSLSFVDIERYFTSGEKRSIIDVEEIKNYYNGTNKKSKHRVKHAFAVYFTGIYLYDNVFSIRKHINKFINDNMEQGNSEQTRSNFLYIWMLTSLYHDLGYDAEVHEAKCDNDYLRYLENNDVLKKIRDEINHKDYSSYNQLDFENDVLGIPKKIHQSLKQYFFVKLNRDGILGKKRVDHGLMAASMMYTELSKLHNDGINIPKKPFDEYGLIFSPEIFQIFILPIVWTIMCHNIWLIRDNYTGCDAYMANGLGELIVDKYKGFRKSVIKLTEHPLLFLLDLTDTFEMLKRDKEFSNDNYKILMIEEDNNNSFSLCIDMRNFSNEEREEQKKKFLKLADDLWFIQSKNFRRLSIIEHDNCLFIPIKFYN